MKYKRGFTLVELLVTATIIGLLSVAGMVSYTSANRNARNARRQTDLEQARAAIEIYRTDQGCYPGQSSSCGGTSMNYSGLTSHLNATGFLSNPAGLVDPKSSPHPQYTYTYGAGGGCTVYRLCSTLEPYSSGSSSNVTHCICNP